MQERAKISRRQILQGAADRFEVTGYGSTSMNDIVSAARMTKGAVYFHFSSKDELFASIVERELRQSLERLSGDGELSRVRLERCLKHYLSMAHVEQPGTGCALPALGAEIARADSAVRQQAEHWICRLHESWAGILQSDSLAWAILSQCVGALVVARMLVSPQIQSSVLSSSYEEVARQIDAH